MALSGFAFAPAGAVLYLLIDELAPGDGATEASTWMITAVVVGVAAGTAFGGAVVSGGHASRGFAAAAVAATLSWLVAYGGRRVLGGPRARLSSRRRERPFATVESDRALRWVRDERRRLRARMGTFVMARSDRIAISGARAHNLKGIYFELPRDALIVVTGLSGSGKSSLAFDTIYAEGQRRYVESLSAYARQFLGQMEKPDVDSIEGLSPAISIDQKTTSRNPRSTVGTVTEIYDYLRLLWPRIGNPHCYQCGAPIQGQSLEQITDQVLTVEDGTRFMVMAPVVRGRKGNTGGARGDALPGIRAGPDRRRAPAARRADRARQEAQARHLRGGRPPGHEGGDPKAPRRVRRGGLPARRRPR